MKRIDVDTAPLAVKKFIRSLDFDASGVEITLDGNVICKIIPPAQLSDAQKATKIAEVRQLLGTGRTRSKRLPATVIEDRIDAAFKSVRGKR